MTTDDADTELDADLIEVVLAEALESLESALWTLRAIGHGEGQGTEVVASLFRCFHSIKGNAAMAGRTSVSNFAHRIESALDVVREAGRALTELEARQLIEAVDLLHPLIESTDTGLEMQTISDQLGECLQVLERLVGPTQTAGAEPVPVFTDSGPASGPVSPEVGASSDGGGGAGQKLRVDAQCIVDSMKVAGELFQIDERLKFFVHQGARDLVNSTHEEAERWGGLTQLSREFDTAIEKLYEQLLDIQRVPVSQLVGPLERSLRDICRKTGKAIELVIQGRDLRIDKNVVQILKDPLMHMVRNAADHGIETPEERSKTSKAQRARVDLSFEDTDDMVVVTLRDDGRGIDPERVRRKVVDKRLLDERAAATLSKDEVLEYIFAPGFSTALQVSELSGRGVGMDVVKQHIVGAGGTVATQTELGEGSAFTLQVPKLGSPVVDGLAVRSGESIFLLPLRNVHRFVARTELGIVCDPAGVVSAMYEGRAYRVCHLPGRADVRRLQSPTTIGVLLEDRKGNMAILVVDEVLGRRKALCQSLTYDACVKDRPTDVAVMGDGKVGFKIRIDEFLKPGLALVNRDRVSLACENETGRERCAS